MVAIIQDIATESLVLGIISREPQLLTEYIELINPEEDFTDNNLRFLYTILANAFLNHDVVDATAINIEVSKLTREQQEMFNKLGGYDTYKRLMDVAHVQQSLQPLYNQLKTYTLLRELDKRGFNVLPHIDKLITLTPDQILKSYEMQLAQVGSQIKNVHDSIPIGDGMTEFYESLKANPDIGYPLPFPIVNTLARGLRLGKVYASGMHSGYGKSREAAYILTFTSIVNHVPALVIVNEQDEEEWRSMLLTCVVNNVFAPKTGITIDEDTILMGKCNAAEDKICQEAAKYIEENSKIQFIETDVYDYTTLKILLKKHKLRGINFAIIDTFKPFRKGNAGMDSWEKFVAASEELKRIVGSEKKGGLNMCLWLTFQLTDESLMNKILNSSSIASGKQIKHNLDFLKMSRQLDYDDKQKIQCRIYQPGNPFNNQVINLDMHKDYYLCVIDKNRGGKDHKEIIYEVDRGKVIFKELGWATRYQATAKENISEGKEDTAE